MQRILYFAGNVFIVLLTTAPAKLPKKKTAAKPKKPSTHPKYSEMEATAISALKERGGSSRQAILKYIMANFNVGKDAKLVNAHLKLALRTGVKNKSLTIGKPLKVLLMANNILCRGNISWKFTSFLALSLTLA
jgi:hypothetical protein